MKSNESNYWINRVHNKLKNIYYIICYFLLASSLFSIEMTDFGKEIVKSLPKEILKKRIAVLKFEVPDSEKDSNLAKILSGEILLHLNKNGVSVYERDDLSLILNEKQLSQVGIITQEDKTLYETKQINYLITGTVFRIDDSKIRVLSKIIDVTNLSILSTYETIIQHYKSGDNKVTYHSHDGFFFNIQFPGFGSQTTNASGISGFDSVELEGTPMNISIKYGISLNKLFILSFNKNGTFLTEPNIKTDPNILIENKLTDKGIIISSYGLGMTFYTESNSFGSVSISVANAIYSNKYKKTKINNGFGFGFSLGKEWWVSDNWAIGPSVTFLYSNINLTDIDVSFKTTDGIITDNNFNISNIAYILAFSATYN
ncbi:MAG: FlgO family outer membrane protein [Spirochaetia bacterium]|nr:FlgO family outer membrane protein [Spirochaetia bacterium]